MTRDARTAPVGGMSAAPVGGEGRVAVRGGRVAGGENGRVAGDGGGRVAAGGRASGRSHRPPLRGCARLFRAASRRAARRASPRSTGRLRRVPRRAAAALARLAAIAALAAATSLAAAGPAAAGAPSRAASPAASPAAWPPHGTPLAGAGTRADPPPMRAGVTYRDSIGPGQTRFYSVPLDARTTAAVSAFALPPDRSPVAFSDGIELRLLSADGTECDSQQAHFRADGDARPIGTAVSRLITGRPSDPCRRADQYVLQVHRTSAGASDQSVWPLELRFVAEPGLRPGYPPPSPLPSAAPSASPTPLTAGTPRPATGGESIDDAAALRTGIWRDRVLPGETRFYKVPVDWGQQATVFADFAGVPGAGGGLLFVGSGVRLDVYSPLRAYVAGDDRAYLGSPVEIGERLPVVAYGNRASFDASIAPVRVAGWYYLAVAVHPDVAKGVRGPVPVTLRIEVAGPAAAPPPYDGDPSVAGIGVSAHDVASADGTAGGGGSSVRPLRLVAFTSFGVGTALLLWLGGWYALARRRSARGAVARAGAGPAAVPGAVPSRATGDVASGRYGSPPGGMPPGGW